MDIEYTYTNGLINSETLDECSSLYSNQYGIWSQKSPKTPGEKIKLTGNRIREGWINKSAVIYQARHSGKLIGYAIAIRLKDKNKIISWVTQLVVHEDYRKQGVAKTLLFSIWGLSDHYAWGIMSSNPYAVRALEKATRRRCDPELILRRKKKLVRVGTENIPFLGSNVETSDKSPAINTHFLVDHSNIDNMIKSVNSEDVPWLLGDLAEGWEWFAFTFQDQEQIKLSSQEIEKMIDSSDQVTKEAYSRMSLGQNQKWQKHTGEETDFIIKECGLHQGSAVLDFGCGQGRHSLELAKNGFDVKGVDYIKELVNKANKKAKELALFNADFEVGDCRTIRINKLYDAVLCLYDVIGSFADNKENLKIIESIAYHLKPSGKAIISVMNYDFTQAKAKKSFSFRNDPNKLLDELKAGQIMEKTGDIFDPDYFLIDEETQIVYRKEQFTEGDRLPVELIVRDRRYRKDEMESMCEAADLIVEWARYVGAGKWSDLNQNKVDAKEILVLCRKK